MITRKFDQEKGILFTLYEGEITLDQVLDNVHKVFSGFDLPKNLRIFEDATNANYKVSVEENHQIMEAVGEYVNEYKSILVAMVQPKTSEAAVNLYYQYQVPFPNFKYKVFATREAGMIWLEEGF